MDKELDGKRLAPPQACTAEELGAARDAGLFIASSQDERDIHDFAEHIRAPLVKRIAELERVQGVLVDALELEIRNHSGWGIEQKQEGGDK